MTKPIRLRTTLSATTILAAGLMLAAAPARAQNLPDTGNVTSVTSGLTGGAPGSTNPGFSTSGAPGGQTLRVDLKDNRTILNWGGTGFDIAAGNTVDFKDARAASGVTGRTDNIAVLNRDLSGAASNIQGNLRSDPNVGVYLINTNGIVFGGSSVVNTGSFLASTRDLTDADFMDGNATLAFSGTSTSGITLASGAQIRTAANGPGTGERMGDLVLIAGSIKTGASSAINATGGDVAMIVADDVVMQSSAGSPLAFTINRGSEVVGAFKSDGGISGRNVLLGLFTRQSTNADRNLETKGPIVATGAAVTDRGVVLLANAAGPGVTLAAAQSDNAGAAINLFGELRVGAFGTPGVGVRSASGLFVSGANYFINQGIDVAGLMELSGNSPQAISVIDARQSGEVVQAGSILLNGATTRLNGTVRSNTGDITIGSGVSVTVESGSLTSARDIVGSGIGGLSASNIGIPTVHAARNVNLTGTGFGFQKLTAGGSITLDSTAVSFGGINWGEMSTTNGNITIRSGNNVGARGVTSAGGGISISGRTVDVGNSLNAAGEIDLNASVELKLVSVAATGAGSDLIINAPKVSRSAVYPGFILPSLSAGRDVKLALTGNVLSEFDTISAGRDVTIGSASINIKAISATTGAIDVDATGNSYIGDPSTGGTVSAAGNIEINVSGMASIAANVSAGGDYIATANNLYLGTGQQPISQSAKGKITLNGGNASITGNGAITITANSDGIGSEALTLISSTGLSFSATSLLRAGPARESDIYVRTLNNGTGQNYNLTLGGAQARSLFGAYGTDAFTSGLTRASLITFGGPSVFTNSVALDGTGVSVGNFQVTNGDLSLRSRTQAVTVRSQISASGDILVRSDSATGGMMNPNGAMTIEAAGRLTGTNVVISSPGTFTNWAGPAAINASGHWVIYASSLTNTGTHLNSGQTALWNASLATRAPDTISGNRYVFSQQPTLTFSTNNFSKVYGTELSGSAIPFTVSGYHPGMAGAFLADTAATAYSGNPLIQSAGYAARASVAGGSYAQTIGLGTLQGLSGYAIAIAPSTNRVTVTPKALTSSVVADNKTYDGNTSATGTVLLNGVVAGDAVGTSGTRFSFVSKYAGTGKAVNVSGTMLTGADSGNYTLTVPMIVFADILKKALTLTATADGKTYDGNTATTGIVSLNGVIAGDTVGTTGSVFTFADKNAGTGKAVNVTGTTLTGADRSNYTLTLPAGALADILQKALTATVTANGKTYDGTTTATGSVALNGVVSGDSVSTDGITFTFADKNAGTGKAVAVGGGLSGADAGNYTVNLPASVLADILKKSLTATVIANGKTYDGSTATTGTVSLNGVVAGDAVGTAGTSFTFADKNAGTGKTVAVTGTTLTGADSGNYTLTVPASALADILKKALTLTATADGKTYDGTTAATGSVSLNGVVAGETVGTTGSVFTFADKNAGTGKAVNVTGTTLTGADSGNYTLTLPAGALADILQKALTATVTANSKTYDGTTAATGSVALNGVVGGDTVSTDGITFTFADKNAGTGKAVAVGGNLSGADAGNYTVTFPATVLADILKKALTADVTANGKTYDGTAAATGTVSLNGVVAGDTVGTTGSVFTFADKNAGTAKTVSVSGTTLTGTDSGNYTLTIPATALADILKKALTATVSADGKTYDGTTAATGSVSLNGVVAGDTVGTTGSVFTFADKNAGTGKTVSVSGTTLTGTDSGNYTLTVPATALADILKKALTATVTANGKTYDGTTTATGSVALTGVVAGDTVGTTGSVFTFADKNAGTGKTVSVAGTTLNGVDSGNYTLTVPATALADILKKALTATVTANGKTYDGTTAATGSVALTGVVSGDTVSTGGVTFAFADKNAGTGKAVAIGGSLSGADAGNYTVNLPATVLADILRKSLTATVAANGKTYDGTTATTGSVALNGVVAGDSVGTGSTAFAFADRNAGAGKVVNVTGTTLTGADSGNYTLTIPATVLADIARRALSVKADDKAKYTGEEDPALTYTLTLGSLVAGDQFSGALARAAGEGPGDYAIDQGNLSAGSNYTVTFTPGALTISVNPATSQQQTLRAVPLPSGIQAPPPAGSGIRIDANALCAEDTSCVAN